MDKYINITKALEAIDKRYIEDGTARVRGDAYWLHRLCESALNSIPSFSIESIVKEIEEQRIWQTEECGEPSDLGMALDIIKKHTKEI